jgi:hypothetical protein
LNARRRARRSAFSLAETAIGEARLEPQTVANLARRV